MAVKLYKAPRRSLARPRKLPEPLGRLFALRRLAILARREGKR